MTVSDYGKVAIVIVTYNRLNDLKVCLDAVRKQSYKNFEIVVVNNGSKDGTTDYLNNQTDITVIHQNNVGGAGGFYTGMKYMYEHDFEWLLLMDDDGIPSENELKELLINYNVAKQSNYGKDCIVNALVVDKNDHEKLAFGWGVNNNRSIYTKDYVQKNFFDGVHPFNGTLICRNIIKNIGFIKKEMFIWGDEEEYMARAKDKGYGIKTITSSIHYHPKEKGLKGYFIPFTKKYFVLIKPASMSHFFYRNKGFIYSHYKEKRHLFWPFLLCHTFYNLVHLRLKEIFKLWYYYNKGRNNNFN